MNQIELTWRQSLNADKSPKGPGQVEANTTVELLSISDVVQNNPVTNKEFHGCTVKLENGATRAGIIYPTSMDKVVVGERVNAIVKIYTRADGTQGKSLTVVAGAPLLADDDFNFPEAAVVIATNAALIEA